MSAPPADPKPTVYLLYGDNEFAIRQDLRSISDQFDDPSTADLNTEHLNGRDTTLGQLEEICRSAPFLAPRRLVVVEHADQLTKDQGADDELVALLSTLPDTTALVLIDLIDLDRRDSLQRYQRRSPAFQWADANPSASFTRAYRRPTGGAFVRWLQEHCRGLQGEIQPQAAHLLAESVADDLYLADQELRKLLDYVDFQRPIAVADVEQLTPMYGRTDIFKMVDSIGGRDTAGALARLHRLLQDEDPRYAFAMIVRQFRLLLQAREAIDLGLDPAAQMGVHPYVIRKVSQQARNFTLPQLERIYQHLLRVDVDSKIGRADLPTALDRLIVGLSG